jgi:hypothetical protein
MARTLYADDEKVAVAWTKALPGIDPTQVATSLPASSPGFVQIRALVNRTADRDINARRNGFVTYDFWAVSTSSKPQWGAASQLASIVRAGMGEGQAFGADLDLGESYRLVRLQAVYPETEPRRIDGDPAGYARYTFDAFLDWVQA